MPVAAAATHALAFVSLVPFISLLVDGGLSAVVGCPFVWLLTMTLEIIRLVEEDSLTESMPDPIGLGLVYVLSLVALRWTLWMVWYLPQGVRWLFTSMAPWPLWLWIGVIFATAATIGFATICYHTLCRIQPGSGELQDDVEKAGGTQGLLATDSQTSDPLAV